MTQRLFLDGGKRIVLGSRRQPKEILMTAIQYELLPLQSIHLKHSNNKKMRIVKCITDWNIQSW